MQPNKKTLPFPYKIKLNATNRSINSSTNKDTKSNEYKQFNYKPVFKEMQHKCPTGLTWMLSEASPKEVCKWWKDTHEIYNPTNINNKF